MEIYYTITFFILGTILGSFYNVVGYRLPKGESILFPSSHCPNCNKRLKPLELIPIFSFFLQGKKCTNCKIKISCFYPIFEFLCGILFSISYLIFGFSIELLIALTFISMLCIIVLSDYEYMIICDSVLIFFSILLIIEFMFSIGLEQTLYKIGFGLLSSFIMFLIKKIGDFLFKKESMGGGDIKLMFVFGLMFGFPTSLLSIFIGSIIGLPISLVIIAKNKNHEVPFGPFLSIGALILLFTGLNINTIINFLDNIKIV